MNIRKNSRYIFCVSPGRSGTHYLQRVFSSAKNVCAVHEPEHQFTEYADLKPSHWDLKNTLLQNTAAKRRALKLAQINELLERAGTGVYAETNPLFSTLWHDVLLDALSDRDMTVVILRRSAAAVLKSLLDLGWFQGRDGNRWMVTAYSVNSLVRAPVEERHATAADLITGYLLNVEMYAQRIKKHCMQRGTRLIELNSEQLFEGNMAAEKVLISCGLEPDRNRLDKLGASGRNKKTIREKSIDTPLETCRNEIARYLDSCAENGIHMPDQFRT
jgi:hypothetical protein